LKSFTSAEAEKDPDSRQSNPGWGHVRHAQFRSERSERGLPEHGAHALGRADEQSTTQAERSKMETSGRSTRLLARQSSPVWGHVRHAQFRSERSERGLSEHGAHAPDRADR